MTRRISHSYLPTRSDLKSSVDCIGIHFGKVNSDDDFSFHVKLQKRHQVNYLCFGGTLDTVWGGKAKQIVFVLLGNSCCYI